MSHQSSPMRDTINRNPESHSPFNSRYVPHLDVLLCHVYVRVCELLHAQIWGLINDINVSDGSRDTRNSGFNFQAHPEIRNQPEKNLVERNLRKDLFFFQYFCHTCLMIFWSRAHRMLEKRGEEIFARLLLKPLPKPETLVPGASITKKCTDGKTLQ